MQELTHKQLQTKIPALTILMILREKHREKYILLHLVSKTTGKKRHNKILRKSRINPQEPPNQNPNIIRDLDIKTHSRNKLTYARTNALTTPK